MKTLKIGIADYDWMKAYTMAIARGEHKPGKNEPKVWFTSIESFAKVLSQSNRVLLTLIAREKPASLTALAELSGRKKSNLSRTLKTMSQYGFVKLKEGRRGTLVPRVLYDRVSLDVSLLTERYRRGISLKTSVEAMEQVVKMEKQQSCTLCKGPFEQLDDHGEHIIPNAIGGKRKLKGFLCQKCNKATGANWDAALAKQLNPISNLLNIKRERNALPDLMVETAKGRSLRHKSDGHITTARYDESIQQVEGKIIINVSAPNIKVLKRHLPGLVRRYPQLKDVNLLQHAEQKKEYVADPMGISLEFGGLDAGRSVVKSCVALAHVVGVHLADLEYAREYLAGENKPCFGYYNEKDVVLNRPPQTFFHCVHVQGDRKTGKIVGYVEYFGCYRIVVLLSDSYSGEAFSECYAIDPVTGNEIPLKVELPDFSTEDIQDIYEEKKVNIETTRSALETLFESYLEDSRKRELSRVLKDAVPFAFTNCGATPGEIWTDEQRGRFTALVMERLTPFLLHQFVNPEFPVDEPDA